MVTITPIAEEKIKELILEEENAVGLRIYVKVQRQLVISFQLHKIFTQIKCSIS